MNIPRYFLYLSYKGEGYAGWQRQPRSLTIQEVIEKSLSVILREEISCTGAGRTDAGVHSKYFVAHFDSVSPLPAKPDRFIYKLNSHLPPEIAVQKILPVKSEAHARFDAISREYQYVITKAKDPFMLGRALYRRGDLDISAMNSAAGFLVEHSDFTSFSKLHSSSKTNICKITDAHWTSEGNLYCFTIRADRFLRNMVRAIVGTMIEIGSGKIKPEVINTIINAKDRGKAGKSVAPEGLYLTDIIYPEEIFKG